MIENKATGGPVGEYNVEVIPKINLSISGTSNSETFHIYTDKKIEITNIEVKALKKVLTTNSSGIGASKMVEDDRYSFHVNEFPRLGTLTNNGKYWYKINVILIDSPVVLSSEVTGSTLQLKFYINYILEGKESRIIKSSTDEEKITYNSKNYYINRGISPYSLQVDSIYRPFFFNSILLFVDEDYLTKNHRYAEKTYGIFTHSIANGCTLRRNVFPSYFIGDIKLNISNINVGSTYTYNVKNQFRLFSEIEDFVIHNNDSEVVKERKNSLRLAHINGVKERGSNDKLMYLPYLERDSVLMVEHGYESSKNLIPTGITYYYNELDNENLVDVYNENNAQEFDTKTSLNISFKVNDAAPDGMGYKTCEVSYNNIVFPSVINANRYTNNSVFYIKTNEYNNNVKYLCLDGTYVNSGHIINAIKNNNVNDDENNIFNILNKCERISFVYDSEHNIYTANVGYMVGIILAVYYNNYDENGNFSYIKDTNKFLVMKIYNVM